MILFFIIKRSKILYRIEELAVMLIDFLQRFKGTVAGDFQPLVFQKSVVPGILIHILKYLFHLLLFR